MQCPKVVILFIAIVFNWAAIDANPITIKQAGNEQMAFEVEYVHMGKNHTEFSGFFSFGEQRTVDISPEATDIRISACYTMDRPCRSQLIENFEYLPKGVCFTHVGEYRYAGYRDSCPLRPPGGFSYTVYQKDDYKSSFEVMYKYNGSNQTESSGEISKGQFKRIQIPDFAVDVKFTLYGYNGSQSSKTEFGSEFNSIPVEKCFESRNSFYAKKWSYFERAC